MGQQVEPGRRTVLKAGLGAATAAFVGSGVATASAAHAVPSEKFPWIIDCGSWGALPPAGALPLSAIRTNKIILHHMAFPNVTDYSREQAIKLARDCQLLHLGNGWSDTGQHFTISRGGYVLEGRRGSLAQLDTGGNQVISAHCPGENGRSIGIENEGTYITEVPPEALLASCVRLCVAICEQYGLHAHDIFGHWDFRHTQCPGIAFYEIFPKVRRRVARELGSAMMDAPERRWPDLWRFVNSPSVQVVQYLLNSHGYSLATDGAFGPLTVAAVQDWQARHGIPVDVDATLTPPTWETLVRVLRPGATGPAISAVQSILALKGFGTTVTGVYDNRTFNAVQRLQRLHQLRPNGELTASTWCAIVGGIVRESFR